MDGSLALSRLKDCHHCYEEMYEICSNSDSTGYSGFTASEGLGQTRFLAMSDFV